MLLNWSNVAMDKNQEKQEKLLLEKKIEHLYDEIDKLERIYIIKYSLKPWKIVSICSFLLILVIVLLHYYWR